MLNIKESYKTTSKLEISRLLCPTSISTSRTFIRDHGNGILGRSVSLQSLYGLPQSQQKASNSSIRAFWNMIEGFSIVSNLHNLLALRSDFTLESLTLSDSINATSIEIKNLFKSLCDIDFPLDVYDKFSEVFQTKEGFLLDIKRILLGSTTFKDKLSRKLAINRNSLTKERSGLDLLSKQTTKLIKEIIQNIDSHMIQISSTISVININDSLYSLLACMTEKNSSMNITIRSMTNYITNMMTVSENSNIIHSSIVNKSKPIGNRDATRMARTKFMIKEWMWFIIGDKIHFQPEKENTIQSSFGEARVSINDLHDRLTIFSSNDTIKAGRVLREIPIYRNNPRKHI